ncbi:hypothetical protein CVU37_00975 [candidate division BRC1 bacterium HGW-BRC1-1]|jgi:thioredoxin-like negative regulator of GroEL|nr:MAG: hypothetical protein CVU37_00975 [candidate division BRC1 bacterium HGW-BRC1-1]
MVSLYIKRAADEETFGCLARDLQDIRKTTVFCPEKSFTMRKITLLIVALSLSAGMAGAQSLYSSWSSAASASRSSNKAMMVVFEQNGCPDCSRMNKNLSASQSRQALKNVIRVRLEYRSNQSLADRFGIGATPTTLVFAPGNTSNPVFREVGAMSIDAIAGLGRSLNSRYGSSAATPKAAEPKETKSSVRDASPSSRSSSSRSQAVAQMPPTTSNASSNSRKASSRAQRQQAYQRADRQAVAYYYY